MYIFKSCSLLCLLMRCPAEYVVCVERKKGTNCINNNNNNKHKNKHKQQQMSKIGNI